MLLRGHHTFGAELDRHDQATANEIRSLVHDLTRPARKNRSRRARRAANIGAARRRLRRAATPGTAMTAAARVNQMVAVVVPRAASRHSSRSESESPGPHSGSEDEPPSSVVNSSSEYADTDDASSVASEERAPSVSDIAMSDIASTSAASEVPDVDMGNAAGGAAPVDSGVDVLADDDLFVSAGASAATSGSGSHAVGGAASGLPEGFLPPEAFVLTRSESPAISAASHDSEPAPAPAGPPVSKKRYRKLRRRHERAQKALGEVEHEVSEGDGDPSLLIQAMAKVDRAERCWKTVAACGHA